MRCAGILPFDRVSLVLVLFEQGGHCRHPLRVLVAQIVALADIRFQVEQEGFAREFFVAAHLHEKIRHLARAASRPIDVEPLALAETPVAIVGIVHRRFAQRRA